MPSFRTTDDTELYLRDWGAGPAVAFLPSMGLSSDMWRHQMLELAAAGFRCVSYDRRGHGRSDDPGRGFAPDQLADDLAALLDHLDLREVTLVGLSLGGAEAVRYLTRHGEGRVARLALVAAWLPFQLRAPDNPEGVDPAELAALFRRWRTDLPGWLAETAAPFFGDGRPGCAVPDGLRDWTLRDFERVSPYALIECNRTVTATDFRPELAGIAVPTLVLHGDADASCPLEFTGRRTAELIPGSRLVVYEHAPHALHLTHRDRLTADLRAFAAG